VLEQQQVTETTEGDSTIILGTPWVNLTAVTSFWGDSHGFFVQSLNLSRTFRLRAEIFLDSICGHGDNKCVEQEGLFIFSKDGIDCIQHPSAQP
jgi:hypothetical protein